MARKYIVDKVDFDAHVGNKSNPHGVTKSQLGLGNVDNTSDINKPISTAVQNALNNLQENTVPQSFLENVNLDTVTKSGMYRLGGSITGCPETCDWNLLEVVNSNNSDVIFQILCLAGANKMWFRGKFGQNSWNSWRLIANDIDLLNYLPKTGGQVNGVIRIENQGDNISGNAQTQIMGRMAGTDFWRIGSGGNGEDNGFVELATNDNGTEAIYVRQYQGSQGDFANLIRTLTLLDGNGNTVIPGHLFVNGGITVNGGGVGGIKSIQIATIAVVKGNFTGSIDINFVDITKSFINNVSFLNETQMHRNYDIYAGSENVYTWIDCLDGKCQAHISCKSGSTWQYNMSKKVRIVEFY